MLKILIGLLLFVSSTQAIAQSKLVVLGDSLSAGYGVELGKGWVVLLQKKLQQQGLPITVVNASISGDTSSGGLARIDAVLQTEKPQWVILELGANDGLRGLSPIQMKANLAAMISRCQKIGAKVLLLGIKIPPNYGKRYNDLFYKTYLQLAQEFQISFMPFMLETVVLHKEMMQPDGLHPNESAQPLIMEDIWQYLHGLLMPAKK